MAYAAVCDASGAVVQVIVVPNAVQDAATYVGKLGVKGTVVSCAKEGAAVGMRLAEGRFYPVWRQTFGATDDPIVEGVTGYPAGTEVWRDGKVWVSTVDFNVWEPGTSGWQQKAMAGPPPWQQPTGAHDAYAKGAQVSYGGKVWTSEVAANVWAPGVYGWVVA